MKIAIIGTGYVGLVVGTGLAENGHSVTCIDRDPERIDMLRNGKIPIYEPGLEELLMRNIEEERMSFTTDTAEGVADKLLIFFCVDTPTGEDGVPDRSNVVAAAEAVGRALTKYAIMVVKSTCPVGTAEKIRETISGLTSIPFDVVSNPEFLKEGAAVDDFMRPDRVVIGSDDVRVLEIMRELYSPFLRTGKPLIAMGIRSAEMAKYAMNTMLAARISLMNELASIAEAQGADITQVREAVMADSRVGSSYLFPGLGFGGSCLPKDTKAALWMGKSKGVATPMLEGVIETNDRQQSNFVQKMLDHYGERIKGARIVLWGVSFKPRTDDIRFAPALRVMDGLLEAGAEVTVFDPVAGPKVAEQYGERVTVAKKMYSSIEGADGLAIITEWREFHFPDFERMGTLMKEKVIFDGRNLYSLQTMREQGFRYISIGRPSV